MSSCLHVGFNPYDFWSVVRNGVFPDSRRHFLYFSVSLVLPHYETIQFIPPPPDVGKPRYSVLIFHEDIYQGLIVHFIPLEEVFPSLVCGCAKFELSTHSVSLCTPAHLRVVVSTFYQGCLPGAHHHLVFYLPSVQHYRRSATFHTDWYTAVTLISPTVTAVIRSVCSLFWSIAFQALSASPLRMMVVLLEWTTSVSFPPSSSHMVPYLSPLISVDNNTSNLFSSCV